MHTDALKTVRELIQTVEDGKEGFHLAAENTENHDLKTLFTHYSHQREQFVSELQQIGKSLGLSSQEDHSTMAGAFHRGWMNLRSAINAHDPAALLAECERGEDHALTTYRKAMAAALPLEVMHAVEAQSLEIKAAHDKVRHLRDLAMAA